MFLFLKEIIYQYVRHKNIKNDYTAKLNNNLSLEEINQIKTELFGKNGLISSQFKNIGSIPETDRKSLHLISTRSKMSS